MQRTLIVTGRMLFLTKNKKSKGQDQMSHVEVQFKKYLLSQNTCQDVLYLMLY